MKQLSLLILACTFQFGFAQESSRQHDAAADIAKKTLASLTLEKKVAQLVCAEISGNYISDDDPKFQQWLALARDHGIGGFVIYGGNPHSAAILLNKLQAAASIPILISTDFEGGPGQQFAGASEFPSNMAFAATGNDELMYRAAKIMGHEGKAMGIHLTYTPVSDISISPENPQESGRSFGGNYDLINKMLKAYVKGYHEEGMLTTAKHFPGRGDMKGGPAYPSFTTLTKARQELNDNEFKIFQYAVDAGVDFMMTEHIAIPAMTGNNAPASVESKLVKGIIRDQFKFKGIITSDDLWYDHVIARFGKDDVAVKALIAGHDIVLKPKDPVGAMAAIVQAVKDERLTVAQIDASVYKLLYTKATLGLMFNKTVDINKISANVGTAEHKAVVQEVADKSVTLLANQGVFPIAPFDPKTAVHITIQKDIDQPNAQVFTREIVAAFPGIKTFSIRPDGNPAILQSLMREINMSEVVIISLFVQRDRHGDPTPLTKDQIGFIDLLSGLKAGKTVVMSFGNPHLIREIPQVPSFLVGYGEGGFYGNQTVYFNSFIKILKGQLAPTGRLPIKVSDEMPIGFGL